MNAFLAAAAFAALPLAAGAVTVDVGVFALEDGRYYGSASLTTQQDVTFAFSLPVALQDVTIAISGTGALRDATLSYSVLGGAPVAIASPFAHIFGIGEFGPGTYSVTYDFTGTPSLPISLTTTVFGTPLAPPAPVPLPAAGGLAAAGIGALGLMRARRRTA